MFGLEGPEEDAGEGNGEISEVAVVVEVGFSMFSMCLGGDCSIFGAVAGEDAGEGDGEGIEGCGFVVVVFSEELVVEILQK